MLQKELPRCLRSRCESNSVNKIEQESPNLMDLILGHKIDLVIDTPEQGS